LTDLKDQGWIIFYLILVDNTSSEKNPSLIRLVRLIRVSINKMPVGIKIPFQ